MTKSQLRTTYREQRDAVASKLRKKLSSQIQHALQSLPAVKQAQTIHCYIAVGSEVETQALIEQLWKLGKTVLVPLLNDRNELASFQLTDWDQVEFDQYGRCSPQSDSRYCGEIDVVIVPGIAYTPAGDRVGSGYGHYDRLLQQHAAALRVAPTFELQLVDQLPVESHDQQIDVLVTEQRIIRTTRR